MLSDEEFRSLLQYLNRPWAGYRKVRKGVKKRLRRHMEQVGCRNIEEYLQHLQIHPEEKRACEQCLLVSISRFFRDRHFWQALKERLFPRIIRDFDPPLRIWSAGCACGEEPYSITILWDLMEASPTLELLATDTQSVCLSRAQEGIFGLSSLKEVPDDVKSAYFSSRKGGRQFRVEKDILPAIQWQQHNLLTPPPPGPFHMIFLRNNLLTYHQGIQLRTAFDRIISELAPGGYLAVGSHEKLPATSHCLIRDPHCPWVYKLY